MKKAVVWVSTVLYILTSLAIIGIVIAAITPRINSARDRATIEQTILMLDSLDSKIQQASHAQGTRLNIELKLSRGFLIIDSGTEAIIWQLNNSFYKYSEPNIPINISNIQVLTKPSNDKWNIELKLNYHGKLDLSSSISILQPAEIPYKLWIENKGNIIEISIA